MPIPKPKPNETESDFIGRCMSNPTMVSEYPDEDVRAGVCYSQWEGKTINMERHAMKKLDVVTSRTKLVDSPNLLAFAKECNIEIDDNTELVRKFYETEVSSRDVKEAEQAIISYVSTNQLDRDREIVVASGIDLKEFRKNPVVLFSHDYRNLPIGMAQWIKVDSDKKSLIAKTKYANHDEAQKIYEYRKDGFPLGESIGFIPKNVVYKEDFDKLDIEKLNIEKKDLKNAYAVITESVLLEYSDVTVPANPGALTVAIKAGIFPKDWEIKIEDDDDIEVEDTITDEDQTNTPSMNESAGTDGGYLLTGKDGEELKDEILKLAEDSEEDIEGETVSKEEEKPEQIGEEKINELRLKLDALTDLVQSLIVKVQEKDNDEIEIENQDDDIVIEKDTDEDDIDPEQLSQAVAETIKKLSPDWNKLLEDHRKRMLGKVA